MRTSQHVLPTMFDFMRQDWIDRLKSRYSFDRHPWSRNPSDPYYKAMEMFQAFTDRIIAALVRDDDTSFALVQDYQLQGIYNGLPCFRIEEDDTTWRTWVKDAILKHPERRTAKQDQWLFIVDMQEATPTDDIVLMVRQAVHWLSMWEKRAFDVDNLCVDPDDQAYFFRNKHAVKDAVVEQRALGESCWICANDFDTDVHRAQQGPCGHVYCHECFRKALAHALQPLEVKYTCAFCRSCLVCGASSCKDHILSHEKADPYPLQPSLHLLCGDRCVGDEKLYGMSPKRYWAFREQSRALRCTLHLQVWHRDIAVNPNHRDRAEEELKQSIEKLKKMAIQAYKLTQEDQEMVQPTARDVIGDLLL